MKRHWIDIDGSVEVDVTQDEFDNALLQFFDSKGWLFIGITKPQEDSEKEE